MLVAPSGRISSAAAGLCRSIGGPGDPTDGGSTRQPIMTAYRQRTLACAAALRDGPQPVKALRLLAEDAAAILLRNVDGWFERERRGVYRFSAGGAEALTRWPQSPPAAMSVGEAA